MANTTHHNSSPTSLIVLDSTHQKILPLAPGLTSDTTNTASLSQPLIASHPLHTPNPIRFNSLCLRRRPPETATVPPSSVTTATIPSSATTTPPSPTVTRYLEAGNVIDAAS
ncbi:hypothetical protein ACLB2K_046449 [Fragaria x ananassa]